MGGGIRLAWGSVRNQVVGNGSVTPAGVASSVPSRWNSLIRNNRVSGSGIEAWGSRSGVAVTDLLIEDNLVDHWISVDSGNQSVYAAT